MKQTVKKYRKAITAALVPVVAAVAAKWGLGLTDAECCAVAGALSGALVAIVPNSYGTG